MPLKISASTNLSEPKELLDYIEKIDKTEVDFIHCDIMDGHFVKARTFSSKMLNKIKKVTSKKLDVHLMVKNPDCKIKRYIRAGADILTIHFEAFKDKQKLIKSLKKIKKMGAIAGMSFSPHTSVLETLPYLSYCDLILVMSVVPGKSGQKFIDNTFNRLDALNVFLKKHKLNPLIEVDGGINESNIKELCKKNVKIIVLGNTLFSSKNLSETVKKFKF